LTDRQWIADLNPDALLADGFDDAIIGVAERCGQLPTLCAWAGDGTPLFLWRLP
jgi:hypothetical protein